MKRFIIVLCVFAVTLASRIHPSQEGVNNAADTLTAPLISSSLLMTTQMPIPGTTTLPPPPSTPPLTTAGVPTEISPKNPREEILICLDAGHGLIDPGALGQLNGATYYEKSLNLAVALRTKYELEKQGYRVLMIRTGDTSLLGGSNAGASYKTADEAVLRRETAKRAGVDLYISIHCNAYVGDVRAYGPLVFYNSSSETTYRALSIARTFSSCFTKMNAGYAGARACDVRAGNSYIVLRELTMPSVLLELGFMTDEGDLSLLIREDWQADCATAITESVEEAFMKGFI